MNGPADQATVIVWKPPAVSWILGLLALPFVALALFVPRFRGFGIVFVTLMIIRLARQTLSVRVTEKEVVLQALVSRRRYSLRHVKHVALAETRGSFGFTTPSVRLDFFESPPVQISGFLVAESNALYEAVVAAWQRVQRDTKRG